MSVVPAPEGYVVDFDDPQRLDDIATYWCAGIGILFSLLFTAQRVYVKIVLRLPWRFDDTLLAISWITSMATQCMILREFAIGVMGVHAWEISLDHFNAAYFSVYVAGPTYVVAGSCTKLALLFFYLRVSPQQWLRYSVFTTMFIITGYSTGIVFALIFACTPIRKSFDITVTEGHCISTGRLYIATAACNIMSDVILLVLPIPMVFRLQMPLKQKFGLFFVFGIGSITVVTSIIRAVLLPKLLTTDDVTWEVAPASLLVIIESNLIIICGMLPTLRKFFRHVAPKIIGESNYGKHDSSVNMSAFKSSKLGPNSPHLVTFGSLPVKSRGYAKFGSGRSNDGYPLVTIDNDITERMSREIMNNSTVNTIVVAGHGPAGYYSVLEDSPKPPSAGSQVPIVTTRIEVSYDRTGEPPSGNEVGTAF